MYVSEQEGDLGQYLLQTGLHNSNTALVKYLFGADPSEVRRDVETAAIAVVRETKDRIKNNKKPLSQDDAIAVAFAGIQAQQSKYTVFGSEIHKACENFWKGRLVTLPTPRHQAYFRGFLYYKNQHVMRPLLVEELLVCPHCGLATQVDWYGEIDGKLTNLDYKTGYAIGKKTPLQLTAQRHVLEHNEYKVDQSQALHISADFAYPVTFETPWEEYETLMAAFEIKKKYMQPKIYPREFADKKQTEELKPTKVDADEFISELRAITQSLRKSSPECFEEDTKKEAPSEMLKTSIEQESALDSNIQGRQRLAAEPDISPTDDWIKASQNPPPFRPYPGLVDKLLPERVVRESQPARRRGRPRKDSLHTSPSANTSSRKAVTRPRSPRAEEELNPSLVRQLSNAKRRKVRAA